MEAGPLRSCEYTLHYGAVVEYTECESLTLRGMAQPS
jgi:hypothetical protein